MDLPMVTESVISAVVRPVRDPSKAARNQKRGAGNAGRRVSQVLCRGPCLGRTGLLAEAYHRRLQNGNKGTLCVAG